MGRTLEARDLRLLVAIAEEGSVAAAARRLDYSQPTASQHLSGLEARLGARLVERSARGARPTELGALLAARGAELLDQLALLEADLRRQAEHGLPTLRLGTFASAGSEVAPRALARLAAAGVLVEIVEAEVPQLLDALRRRDVHAALLFDSADDPLPPLEGVAVTHLLDDDHLVLLPRGHAAAAAETVRLADLREERWISARADEDPSHAALARACRREGFEPRFGHRLDSFSMTQGFVAAGLGVSLLPRMAVAPLRDDVIARPLTGARVVRSVRVACLDALAPSLRERLLEALAAEL
ncbi:LysR family transcriptional regulator [Conexibacter stalactiti]|uniref:LysR family transcriptional regulator n=1 Tax=Conexibacter stalactiti TaxID=1940611 RepID=A0ABU4HUQ5_9ACTN|nr:LysR family transcriptional regulator [Conexibacter stalactiti]MDW5596970.1 LysR family transcriptional regulator [Conexibacter stalactiti]MEC5037612.1 LysR family transcriptional regulator [Conexibacter stalactiti]